MELPFTSDQFFGVFAAYNRAFWFVALALWFAAAAAVVAAWRDPRRWSGALMSFLATLWMWNAAAYHALFFTRINDAAWLFAVLFAAEGVVLFRAAAWSQIESPSRRHPMSVVGAALTCYALTYPFLSIAIGRRYPDIPTFGVPCPTAILTIGVLLALGGRPPLLLAAVPAAWSFVGGSAAVLFGVWTDYMLLVGGVLLTGSLVAPHRRSGVWRSRSARRLRAADQ